MVVLADGNFTGLLFLTPPFPPSQVLFLDSDNLPLIQPELVFEGAEYRVRK